MGAPADDTPPEKKPLVSTKKPGKPAVAKPAPTAPSPATTQPPDDH